MKNINNLFNSVVSILIDTKKPLNLLEIANKLYLDDYKEIERVVKNEISLNGQNSIFFHAGKGEFGLRKWLVTDNTYNEVLTSPIGKTNPFNEIIAVIDIDSLSKFSITGLFTEFKFTAYDFRNILKPMIRKEAEACFSSVQLVSCFVVRYKNELVTFYKTNYQPEKRLDYTKQCINFGGHIAYDELFGLFDGLDPASSFPFVIRELLEEININCDISIKQLGLVYDDTVDIGKQHLGLVYEVNIASKDIHIKEKKLFSKLQFQSINDLLGNRDNFDSWSRGIIQYYQGKSKWLI